MSIKNSDTSAPILLGTHIGEAHQPLKVFYEGDDLRSHKNKPWLTSWLHKRDGKTLQRPRRPTGDVFVEDEKLAEHSLLVGNSGSGKTRLALHLWREQLRRGASGIFMDVKPQTIQHAIQAALDAGMSREQITVIWPQENTFGVPGWNPFAVPLEDAQKAAGHFASTLKGCFDAGSWGARMNDLMISAATVIAGQNLSPWELVQFLQPGNGTYRNALLDQARTSPAWEMYEVRHQFFDNQFKSIAKTESVGAVLNKLTTLVSDPYFKAMLQCPTDQLQLETLWKEPRVIIIHLNEDALTKNGTGLLAGMIAQRLYAVSMKRPGDVPVVMVMDEIETQERYLGDSLSDILAKSRAQGIRMIGACQNIGQMSDNLRKLFMGAHLQTYFNLEAGDARTVASALTAPGTIDTRVSISSKKDEWTNVSAYIVDKNGNRLTVTETSWKLFETTGRKSLGSLKILGRASHLPELFVVSPADESLIPIDDYLKGLSPSDYSFRGPSPIWVTVTFPRPVYKVEEKQTETDRKGELEAVLKNLPNRQAVVKLRGGTTAHIAVTRVEFSATPDPLAFLGNGQTAGEITDTAKSRKTAIDALSGRRGAVQADAYEEVSADGNL